EEEAGTAVPQDDAGLTLEGEYGRLTIRADGSYDYAVDEAKVRHLPQGASVEEVFQYTLSDGEGGSDRANPDISHWRGLREFGRSAVSRRFRGRRDRRGLWRLVRMAMFPALWKVRRKAAAYAAALVNRAWARAHSACQ